MSDPTTIQNGLQGLLGAVSNVLTTVGGMSATQQKCAGNGIMSQDMINAVDWASASGGWVTPIASLTAHVNGLVALTTSFSSALSTALNATSEGVRTDPLWNLITATGSTSYIDTQPLLAYKQTLATAAINFNTVLTAAGGTPHPALALILSLLQGLPDLVHTAIQCLQFFDRFQNALAEDTAGIMLWAAKGTSVSDKELPFLLKTYKYTNTTQYDADGAALTTFAATNWVAIQQQAVQ